MHSPDSCRLRRARATDLGLSAWSRGLRAVVDFPSVARRTTDCAEARKRISASDCRRVGDQLSERASDERQVRQPIHIAIRQVQRLFDVAFQPPSRVGMRYLPRLDSHPAGVVAGCKKFIGNQFSMASMLLAQPGSHTRPCSSSRRGRSSLEVARQEWPLFVCCTPRPAASVCDLILQGACSTHGGDPRAMCGARRLTRSCFRFRTARATARRPGLGPAWRPVLTGECYAMHCGVPGDCLARCFTLSCCDCAPGGLFRLLPAASPVSNHSSRAAG